MKSVQTMAMFIVITLGSTFLTEATDKIDSSMATLEVVSLDESQKITFEATLISYEAEPTDDFKAFGRLRLTTPYTAQIESEDFVGVFKKIEGNANMRVSLTIPNRKGKDTFNCGAENCILIRKNAKGYASAL